MGPATSATTVPTLGSAQNHVINLAKEIEHLAGSGLPPQEFFRRFLEKLVAAVAAPAGAVWLVQQGRFQLCCDVRLKQTSIHDTPEAQRFHQKLLGEVAANGQTQIVHTGDEPKLALPNRHLLVLAALRANGVCHGVVEIFQRPDVPAQARAGYLQFIEQMAAYASLYLERAQAPAPPANSGGLSEEAGRFALQLQRSLRVNEVAYVAANDGRLLVNCDRVSVILQRGRSIRAKAISGQKSIHPRANLVKTMVKLSREVIRSGVEVKYTGNTDMFAPQVKERLADFVQESGARMVYVRPLRTPSPLIPKDKNQTTVKPGRVFGCLVLEQFHQSEPSRELAERVDWLTSFSAAALHNARTHQSIFLLPLWTMLGQVADWMSGRKLLKGIACLSVLAAIVCALVFVKMDYRVEADGRMMPVVRREIFVPYDSEVVDVLVSSGARVSAGQLLVRLRNNELRSELVAIESQREEKRKLQLALLAERDDAIRGPSSERANRIAGELAKTTAELVGIERKLKVLEDRERSLNVTSPIDGVVSTFEVDQLLKHRPVRRGEVLLEVMDDSGPWHLELNLPEHRTGHLLEAQEEMKEPLPIEFLLVTSPEQTHHALLNEVGTRVVTLDDNRSVVELLATLSPDEQVSRRIGAEVRAKVHCGQKSVGFTLFGDVIEFIQKYLWL